jgi:hypothetical protein
VCSWKLLRILVDVDTEDPTLERPSVGPDAVCCAPWVALAALAVGPWLSSDGLGWPLCWIKRWTGFPCLSCGLTRSFLHALHGDWRGAFTLHPLGPPLLLLCVCLAATAFLPGKTRRRGAQWLRSAPGTIRGALLAVVTVLLVNGIYRLWWILGVGRPSPW